MYDDALRAGTLAHTVSFRRGRRLTPGGRPRVVWAFTLLHGDFVI